MPGMSPMAGVGAGSAPLRSSFVIRVASSGVREVALRGMGASVAAGLAGWEAGGGWSGVVAHADSARITIKELRLKNFMV